MSNDTTHEANQGTILGMFKLAKVFLTQIRH